MKRLTMMLAFVAVVGCTGAPKGNGPVYAGKVTMRPDVESEKRCAWLLDPHVGFRGPHLPGSWFAWAAGDIQSFDVAARVTYPASGRIYIFHVSGVDLAGTAMPPPYSGGDCTQYRMDAITPIGHPEPLRTSWNDALSTSTTRQCAGSRLELDWHVTLLPLKGARFDDHGEDHSCAVRVEGTLKQETQR